VFLGAGQREEEKERKRNRAGKEGKVSDIKLNLAVKSSVFC
jgi:hypothetical protein